MSSTTNEIYMWVYENVYGTYQSLTTENKTGWNTCAKKVVYRPISLELAGNGRHGRGKLRLTMKR